MRCPKCGEGKMGPPLYVEGSPMTGQGEHLRRTCTVCRYTLRESTQDSRRQTTDELKRSVKWLEEQLLRGGGR